MHIANEVAVSGPFSDTGDRVSRLIRFEHCLGFAPPVIIKNLEAAVFKDLKIELVCPKIRTIPSVISVA